MFVFLRRELGRRMVAASAVATVVILYLLLLRVTPTSPPPHSFVSDFDVSASRSSAVSSRSSSQSSSWPSSSSVAPSTSRCLPRQDLMFLKTHKCASTTVQRIFLRYGKRHELTWVLPQTGNYLGSPVPFKAAMIPRSLQTPDGKYNMMVVHTRFNLEALSKVMREDALWVTIVREPLNAFESLWDFFELQKFYKMPLEKFARQPYSSVARNRKLNVFGIHQMFFDMGYTTVEDYKPGELAQTLKRLDDAFDLVMVAERFDESLVLLKNLMCWETEDITYLTINHRDKIRKTNISEETRENLQRLNHADVQLYDFFYQIFERKVEEFGKKKMNHELQELRAANKRLEKACVVQNNNSTMAKNMNWFSIVKKVAVNADDPNCVDLVKTELSFLDEVRERQRARLRKLKSNVPMKTVQETKTIQKRETERNKGK
ncbi:galactosylceramide sulfotransferase [Procambarus clarkii]|uniref:galactosylceramide sulfotransferase n=1 Tax=Procambarus clarkii TaxID=6728 RepID=UPI0037426A3B